jgi:hypothetical protein
MTTHILTRAAATALALLLGAGPDLARAIPQAQNAPDRQQQSAETPPPPASSQDSGTKPATTQGQPVQADPAELPDSPGMLQSQAPVTAPQTATGQEQQQQPSDRANDAQQPVGTAAAEIATSGVAASKPAGVAIAPAKQGRARSLLIKVGALVGAGVAVGAVMALSASTPSKPPGAH